MQSHGYWDDDRWNESKHVYTFETGTQIEFISVDTYGKAHGPRRDVLFVNECNNLPFNIVDQLITRTRKVIWLDWNPVSEFWFYTEMLNKRDDIDFITLTYKDNEALDENTVKEIESHKHRKGWWKVYGEGQLGEIEGRIYTGWQVIDEIPHEASLRRRGLDFGYSEDPSAVVDIYYYNGGYIFDERCYQKGLTNPALADLLMNLPSVLTIADSAEPKSIDEIKAFGISIIPCIKGADSRRYGIKVIQNEKISITRNSSNLLKEYRNYLWKIDKEGAILMEPEDGNDHCLDAVRYAMASLIPIIRRDDYIKSLPIRRNMKHTNPAR
jgi:phage terminase large subunit